MAARKFLVTEVGPSGSVTVPTYSFSSTTNTGMWSSATGTLDFTTAGTNALSLTSAGQAQLPVAGSTGGLMIGGDADLYRIAANRLATSGSFKIGDSVAIGGVSDPSNSVLLRLNRTRTDTGAGTEYIGMLSDGTWAPTSDVNATTYGIRALLKTSDATATGNITGIQIAGGFTAEVLAGTRTFTEVRGATLAVTQDTGAGTISTAMGARISHTFNGTVTNAYGLYIDTPGGTATIGTQTTGIRIENMGLAGSPLSTAFQIDAQSGSTTNWAMKIAGGQSYHAGNLRIGSAAAPTVPLDVTGAALFSSTVGVSGILSALATGKTAITVADSGAQNSGMTIGGDTNWYRDPAGNQWRTDDTLSITAISDAAVKGEQTAGNVLIRNRLVGTDANAAWAVFGNGDTKWGPGGGTAVDTTLVRSGVAELTLTSTLLAGNLALAGIARGTDIFAAGISTRSLRLDSARHPYIRFDDNSSGTAGLYLDNFDTTAANGVNLWGRLSVDGTTGIQAGRILIIAEQTWTATASTQDSGMIFYTTRDGAAVEGGRFNSAQQLILGQPAGGSVTTPALSFTGDLNTGIYSSAADTLDLVTGGTSRMEIDSSGKVGFQGAPGSTTGYFFRGISAATTATVNIVHSSSGSAMLTLNRESDLTAQHTGFGIHMTSDRMYWNSGSNAIFQMELADTAIDHAWLYDGAVFGSDLLNFLLDTEYTTATSLNADTNDFLYFTSGNSSLYTGLYFELSTLGAGYTLVWEYSKGAGVWQAFTPTSDGTSNWTASGWVNFGTLSGWAVDTINGVASQFGIRVSTSTGPSTVATALNIGNTLFNGHYCRWYNADVEKFRVDNQGRLLSSGVFFPGESNGLTKPNQAVQSSRYISDDSANTRLFSNSGFAATKLYSSTAAGAHPTTPDISFTGDTNTGIYSSAADTLDFTTNGAQKVSINSAGQVALPITGSTGGLLIGTDANLYRVATGALQTDGTGTRQFNIATTDNTTASVAITTIQADTPQLSTYTHASARTTARFGLTLGGWAEISLAALGAGPNGLVIGTRTAVPLVFGTNNVEVGRFTSAGQFQLPVTGATGGLLIGGDTNLYRSAADTLKTDDALHVGSVPGASLLLSVLPSGAVGDAGWIGVVNGRARFGYDGSPNAVMITDGGGSKVFRLELGSAGHLVMGVDAIGQVQLPAAGSTGGLLIGGDTTLYRQAANILATDDSFVTGGLTGINDYTHTGVWHDPIGKLTGVAATVGTTIVRLAVQSETNARLAITNDGVLLFGGGSALGDTNVYRGAANQVKTDDDLMVVGNVGFNGQSPTAPPDYTNVACVVLSNSFPTTGLGLIFSNGTLFPEGGAGLTFVAGAGVALGRTYGAREELLPQHVTLNQLAQRVDTLIDDLQMVGIVV